MHVIFFKTISTSLISHSKISWWIKRKTHCSHHSLIQYDSHITSCSGSTKAINQLDTFNNSKRDVKYIRVEILYSFRNNHRPKQVATKFNWLERKRENSDSLFFSIFTYKSCKKKYTILEQTLTSIWEFGNLISCIDK